VRIEHTSGEIEIFDCGPAAMREIKTTLTLPNPRYIGAVKAGKKPFGIPKVLEYYTTHGDTGLTIPGGCMQMAITAADRAGESVEVEMQLQTLPEVDYKFRGDLRLYQLAALAQVTRRDFGVLEAPTGSGKTVMGCYAIAQRRQPALITVHNRMLQAQWVDAVEQFLGVEAGTIGGGKPRHMTSPVIVAIINSLARCADVLAEDIGHLVVDECVPAGTMVDGVPIEQRRVGDRVECVNHSTGAVVRRRVTKTYFSQPSRLISLCLRTGSALVCTPGHPVYTRRGYVPALELRAGDFVIERKQDETEDLRRVREEVHPEELELNNDPVLLSGMQGPTKVGAAEDSSRGVQAVRKAGGVERQEGARSGAPRRILLLGRVRPDLACEQGEADYGRHEQEACIGTNEEKQPHAPAGDPRESVSQTEGDGPQATYPRRERARAHGPAEDAGGRSDVGHGGDYKDRKAPWIRIPNSLQGGRGKHRENGCGGGGRAKPLRTEQTETGPEKGALLAWSRVDRVEIHEPGSDGRFGGLCPDGLVYNLEVEHRHNYFADGILVHNCHRAPAGSYWQTLKYFGCRYRLGLSATPYRRDGLTDAIGWALGPTTTVERELLVRSGHVLPTEVEQVGTDFVTDTDPSEHYQAVISAVVTDGDRNRQIVDQAARACADGLVLVLSDRVEHLEMINYYTRTAGGVMLHGQLGAAARRDAEAKIAAGKVPVILATTQLVGEGFNLPAASTAILATPIKWSGRLLQAIGRVLRPAPGKTHGRIIDLCDWGVPVLANGARARAKVYRELAEAEGGQDR